MILTQGKTIIKNFFGGQAPSIADSIAIGTGTTAVTLGDASLAAEVLVIPAISINADLDNNRIVFKAIIPPGVIATVFEAGLYYLGSVPTSRQLVARTVLATPQVVSATIPTEIEYSLGIAV
jgi:carbonic anhydrase/acetyltransferase-like protein (isoleucine patch superfamily)